MKVSVQIPTYNQESYIQRSIKSALMQDYEELEIVVLDDCSTDQTFQLAKSIIAPNLRVVRNERNLGRASTYRRLLYELVTGEYVVNLDADDYFTDPHFISKAVRMIKENENIVFYQACAIGKSKSSQYRFWHRLLKGKAEGYLKGDCYFVNFHRNEFFGHLSSVYQVNLAREVGFYEYNNLTSDAESLLKLALQGNVYLDNKVIGVWSIHENNESNHILQKNSETIDSFKRLKNYSVSYIGKASAEQWYKEALAVNQSFYMEQLAKKDFKSFLKESLENKYIKIHFLRLLIKKTFNKI